MATWWVLTMDELLSGPHRTYRSAKTHHGFGQCRRIMAGEYECRYEEGSQWHLVATQDRALGSGFGRDMAHVRSLTADRPQLQAPWLKGARKSYWWGR